MLDALTPHLKLHTLRLYAYNDPNYAGMGYSSDRPTAFWTQVWVEQRGRLGRRRSPVRGADRDPVLPEARQLVIFSSLVRRDEYTTHVELLPHRTTAEELVIHFTFKTTPLARIVLGDEALVVPSGLQRAVVIFTPTPEPTEADITAPHSSEGWKDTIADVAAVAARLGVPVTVVGFELLARAIGFRSGEITEAKAMLRGVTLVDARTYAQDVGPETWALYTTEGGGEGMLQAANGLYWAEGEQPWLHGCPEVGGT